MSAFYDEVQDDYKDQADELIEKAESVQGGVPAQDLHKLSQKESEDSSDEEKEGAYTVNDIDDGEDSDYEVMTPVDTKDKVLTNSSGKEKPVEIKSEEKNSVCEDKILDLDSVRENPYYDAVSATGKSGSATLPGYSKIKKFNANSQTDLCNSTKSDDTHDSKANRGGRIRSEKSGDKCLTKSVNSHSSFTRSLDNAEKRSTLSPLDYAWYRSYSQEPQPLPALPFGITGTVKPVLKDRPREGAKGVTYDKWSLNSGLVKPNIYELVGQFEHIDEQGITHDSSQSSHKPSLAVHGTIARKEQEESEINSNLISDPLPGLQSDQVELAANSTTIYDVAKPVNDERKKENKNNYELAKPTDSVKQGAYDLATPSMDVKKVGRSKIRYDPPWNDDVFVNPMCRAATEERLYDDPDSTPIQEPRIYDTPLTAMELSASGRYDHLSGRMKNPANLNRSGDHTYGINSAKRLELSANGGAENKFQPTQNPAGFLSASFTSSGRGEFDPLASGKYDEVAEEDIENIYEAIGEDPPRGTIKSIGSQSSWGDSEFDDEDSDSKTGTLEYPNRPLPPPPANPAKSLIGRIPSFNSKRPKAETSNKVEEIPIKPVNINLEKHPPPQLPPAPGGLTKEQEKKRHVIGDIIKSEKSYIESLDRVIKEYTEHLLFTFGLSEKESIRIVLSKAQDIANLHRLFQLELAECVCNWDVKEEIGNIFTASFSREMVIDPYSAYVNKFSEAMEDIKSAETAKPGFQEFLNKTAQKSVDRLTIFALMVKPIQRFPQFIMFMKDLLKYTPHNHHDRFALQSALTDLENVTHKLNERKRESEQSILAKNLLVLLKMPNCKFKRQIRQDDLDQVLETGTNGSKTKTRRLYLLDNSVCCCTVSQRTPKEVLRVRWITPIQDLDLEESTVTPEMQDRGAMKRVSVQGIVNERNEDNLFPLAVDLHEMVHDYSVLVKISNLVSKLKRSYQHISPEITHEELADLQKKILVKKQQVHAANSLSLTLYDPLRKQKYEFQTGTPELKQEWCIDFLMAKLALDAQNKDSWYMSNSSCVETDVIHQPAMYMKHMSVDVPRNYTRVKCAVPVFLPEGGGGSSNIGVQSLWVVTTSDTVAQISLVSIQTTKPALMKSFQAAKSEVIAVETVPGFARTAHDNASLEDTVWMSTRDSQILVYSLSDEDGILRDDTGARKPRSIFHCHGVATTIKYADDRVFVGLDSGTLIIYDRDEDGAWMIENPHPVEISSTEAVTCIIAVEDELWVACGDTIHMIPIDENEIMDTLKCEGGATIQEMVRSGCGLWISFKDQSYVHLYHIESKKHLQEINIARTIDVMMSESKPKIPEKKNTTCVVTTLMASRGLLWIGTNLGIICSFPLPLLRDGIPKITCKPNVSLHSHNGPVKFLIPIYCGTVNRWYKSKGLNSTESVAWRENKTLKRQGQRNSSDRVCRSHIDDIIEAKSDYKADSNSAVIRPKKPEAVTRSVRKSRSLEELDKLQSDVTSSVTPAAEPKKFNRKSMTLRTELAAKLKMRQQAMDKLNPQDEENEVSMFYGALFHSGNSERSNSKDQLSKDSTAAEDKTSEKPNIGSESERSATPPIENKLKKTISSLSIRLKPTRSKNQHDSNQNVGLTHGMSNERRDSRVFDAMQKRNCNAVIVVSGGDGYIDWRRSSQKSSESNVEALLMLWMYKF